MIKQYRGRDCLKRRAWTVSQFKGGLGKKEGGVFEEGGFDTPIHIVGQVWLANELWFKGYIEKCTLSHVLILIMTTQIW